MKKGINKYLGALITGTALLAVPSCTDTWSEHYYQAEDSNTATENVWELIEGREDLSKFRSIVSKAKFYRDETHPAYTVHTVEKVGEDGSIVEQDSFAYYTFKDVLCANAPITVWAPVNDALTEEEWQKYEEMAEKDGYNLQQQFIGNHMAIYRHTMTKNGKGTLRLINNKFAHINYDEASFEKTQVTEKNIGATNGLLHIIDQKNQFLYNIYEYIKFSGEVKTFSEYLVKRDTTYFMESASIEGLPDENGNPTYVDSVYFQGNLMFDHHQYPNAPSIDASDAWLNDQKFFRAQINTEDSAFVMIVPTDVAWQNAVEKLTPYYTYADTYPRMDKTTGTGTSNQKAKTDIFEARHSYTNGKGYGTTDSLSTVNIEMDIICPLVFNVNLQPQINHEPWTVEKFMSGGYRDCEYLLNTKGDTIRDIYETINGVKTLVWEKNSLFEGSQIKEIKEMSNGYAVITNEWNFAHDFWMRNIEFEAPGTHYYDKGNKTSIQHRTVDLVNYGEWIKGFGRCSDDNYRYLTNSDKNPEYTVTLQGSKKYPTGASVMSGKYDVQLVLAPTWFEDLYKLDEETDTAAFLQENLKKNKIKCTLYYWDEDWKKYRNYLYTQQAELEGEIVEFHGERIDTITVMKDVEFPFSYHNLKQTYPILLIEGAVKNQAEALSGYDFDICIDQIILKSKEN